MEAQMPNSNVRWPADIRTPDQRLRVFVSSTLGELGAERSAARSAIEQLRLAPVMFESGARPHPAQAVYKAYLEQSDVFVGIYWQRYGWVGPGMTVSGLEDEFCLASRMPRLLYVKRPAPGMEPGLRRMLDEIRSAGGLAYKPFADAAELRDLLLNDLSTLLAERFGASGRGEGGHGVPSPVTALVGRDRDVSEVARLLSGRDHRLVVLTGTGGIGKTRLALAAAERSKPQWPDGVAFVDLSLVTDPKSVPEAIASALGFVGQGRERPIDTLRRRLAERDMLIVLDNFEHVLQAAPVVAELLQGAPGVHVLVTSRVVLRVRGEQERRVDPLPLPQADTKPATLAQAPAVRLFVERAQDVSPGFELTDSNAASVAELCRRLDGVPLALELAAGWMRLLTPGQMLERLDERMDRPGGLADLPGRQQTLTATLEWSYDLLSESARRLFARLSVFAAPFTADGAQAVSGWDGLDATECLATLLDHSMISPAQRTDGERAFRLLELVRRFAFRQLEDPDQALSGLEGYLLEVLEKAAARHGSQDWAQRRLDSEQPNLQVVLRWTADRRRPAGPLLRRIGDAWVWMLVRGNLRWDSELRQQIESLPAAALASESDRMAWHWLQVNGLIADGRYAQLAKLLDDILPAARRLENPSRLSHMVLVRALSRPYTVGSPSRAEFEEALSLERSSSDPVGLGYVLSHFGIFLSVDGDVTRARALHEEMLPIARSLADDNQRAEAHYDLATDDLAVGNAESAYPHLAVAARHYQDIDHRDGLARCLGALSGLALERNHSDLAAWLVGATAAARDNIGLVPWPLVDEAERRVIARVRAQLDAGEFTAHVATGRAHETGEALAQALSVLESPVPAETW
jgi:predicted ATPase